MKKLKILFVTVIAFILTMNVSAQDVISVADAAVKLKEKKTTVFVDCRKAKFYKKRHIKNAVNLEHKKLYKEGPVKSMLKSPQEIAKIFGKLGISESKTVILYDDGKGKYSGRIYWILKYLGAKDVKVLDGHIKAWQGARKPVTMAATMARKTAFTPKLHANYLAQITDVKKAINNKQCVIVDVRAANEFNGSDESELRKGHIPSAINLEFKNVLNAKGELKSNEDLKSVFESAGITSDKEVILYCASSVRAGIVFMALHSGLQYPKVKVYDGAFYEWEADSKNEVVK